MQNTLFTRWLLLTSITLFAFYLLWDFGFIGIMLASDKTWLSVIILIIFSASTLYSGFHIYQFAQQLDISQRHLNKQTDTAFPLFDHYQKLHNKENTDTLMEWLSQRIRAPFSSNWFIADLLLKLGLIGTVIGFIMMLGALTELEHLDISEMKNLLSLMSQGMKTALFTTLSGLVCGSLLGLQNNMLDNAADKLMSDIIELSETAQSK